jgi:N-methylhydantoinase A/oxoprolinase/acetone carboxylase beta subunit
VAGAPRTHTVATGRGKRLEATVVARDTIEAAGGVAGPGIISEYDATTWVPPGWFARVATSGDLVLTLEAVPAALSADVTTEVAR